MNIQSNFDLQVMQDHFPDGTEIYFATSKWMIEICAKGDPGVLYKALPQDLPGEPRLIKTDIILQEIEPETGIYAAISPITHAMYVYVDPYEYAL